MMYVFLTFILDLRVVDRCRPGCFNGYFDIKKNAGTG